MHSDLVKTELLPDFHELWPERFNNKTNGVTPRRWVLHANPRLTRLLSSRIGSSWIDLPELARLQTLAAFADDEDLLDALHAVKQANKRDAAELVRHRAGVEISADAMYVVQVKRVHEYKRQLLACLQIVAHYLALKRNPDAGGGVPRAYLFAGKAAPGYQMAKLHIRLINDVAAVINNDPAVRGKLALAFIPNYGVSLAQAIIPAADLSVQISTAGKEASGTSNMKFALNGALTIGTLDGANVEIRDAVGHDNFFLFGLTAGRGRRHARRRLSPRRRHRGEPRAGRGARADRVRLLQPRRSGSLPPRSSKTCAGTTRTWCAPTSTPTSRRKRAPPPPTPTRSPGRAWRSTTSSAAAASPATPPSASTPRRSGASNRSARTWRCSTPVCDPIPSRTPLRAAAERQYRFARRGSGVWRPRRR